MAYNSEAIKDITIKQTCYMDQVSIKDWNTDGQSMKPSLWVGL